MVAIGIWFKETRPRFLTLSFVLPFLGGTLAAFYGSFSWADTLPAAAGIVLLHVSVNTLNDYWDFRSGLDLRTRPTTFSGGSGILPAGLMRPRQVLALGLGSFAAAVPIGLYFVWKRGPALLPLLVFAAVAVLFYTTRFLKIGFGVPEVMAGLGLGMLPVLGTCFVNQGFYDWRAVYASMPAGLLVFNLLLLNEFPDIEADGGKGRRTLPVQFGWKAAAVVYATATAAVYLWIAGGVTTGALPAWSCLAFLTLPAAIAAVAGVFGRRDREKLVRSLGANVLVVLLTQVLMGAGILIHLWAA